MPFSTPCFWLLSPGAGFPSFFWDSTASSSFLMVITLRGCVPGVLSGAVTAALGEPPLVLGGLLGTSFFSLSPPLDNPGSFLVGWGSLSPGSRLPARLLLLLSMGWGAAGLSSGLSSRRGERSRADSSSRSRFRLLASFQSSSQVG